MVAQGHLLAPRHPGDGCFMLSMCHLLGLSAEKRGLRGSLPPDRSWGKSPVQMASGGQEKHATVTH